MEWKKREIKPERTGTYLCWWKNNPEKAFWLDYSEENGWVRTYFENPINQVDQTTILSVHNSAYPLNVLSINQIDQSAILFGLVR